MNSSIHPRSLNLSKYFLAAAYLSLCLLAPLMFSTQSHAAPAVSEQITVNINTASAEELSEKMIGVGKSKAQLIVDFREENGGFRHIDELVEVKGIGEKTLEKNKSRLTL